MGKIMKRKLLALAIGSAVAVQSGIVLSDATVYGKINVSAQQEDLDYLGNNHDLNGLEFQSSTRDVDHDVFNSNASRIGFKGKAKINDDVDAVFKLEYEAFVDDGDDGSGFSSEFNQRNIVGGLSSKTWGTIQGGKNDTPLKMAADGTDQFNDLVLGDINNYMVGENREDNIIMYTSPTLMGFTGTFGTMVGEDKGVGELATDNDEDGLFDRMSASVKYAYNDNMWAALAFDDNVRNADIIRLVGQATVGDFTFDAHWQTAEVHNDDLDNDGRNGEVGEGMTIGGTMSSAMGAGNVDLADADPVNAGAQPKTVNEGIATMIEDQDAWMINGKYQLGDWAFKAQYGHSKSSTFGFIPNFGLNASLTASAAAAQDHSFDADQVALGVDYALSKNVTVYGYVADISVDTDGVDILTTNGFMTDDDSDLKTGGVGLEIKF
jgi:predicted porin